MGLSRQFFLDLKNEIKAIRHNYDNEDKIISRIYPNGVTTSYDYDDMDRLKRLKDISPTATLFDRQYSYNSASQIQTITEPANTRNFGYDLTNRLQTVTASNNQNENYLFDDVGNRTGSHLSSTYGYQPFNKLTSTQTGTYAHDANGNTISKSEGKNFWRYGWDYENRMTAASTRKQTVRYRYDALGRRVQRYIPGGKENTKFIHDGQDVLADDNAGTLTKYQNGPGIDNKLRVQTGGSVNYFIADHLGSTNGLADSSGALTTQTAYDSFGNQTSNLSTRYGFTGRETDNFTGLMHYRARFYDPNLGRFISEDPIGFGGGDINLYGYVWNNPGSFTDPMGLDGWGNDTADWMDDRIEYSRNWWQGDQQDWWRNGWVNTGADLASGSADMFRVGSGLGYAMYAPDENIYGRLAFAAMDIPRGAGLFAALAGPFAGGAGGSSSRTTACPLRNTIQQEAQDLVALNGGKNRVTIRSDKFQLDIDLQGKSHAGVPTPHTKLSSRNFQAPGNKKVYNTSNKQALLERSSPQDIRLARGYLKSRNR